MRVEFFPLCSKDTNLYTASFTLNNSTAYKNLTPKMFYFNNYVAILWKGHGNDCTIEFSLIAYVIQSCKKMFRPHFHFAGNQTEIVSVNKMQNMGCRPR